MFNDRSKRPTFFSAPPSVTSLAAAFLEPTLTVAVFLLTTLTFGKPIVDSDLMLCLLAFTLTFPGRNQFTAKLHAAAVRIFFSWIELLAILWLFAFGTDGLDRFDRDILMVWMLLTPPVQWLALAAWRAVRTRRAKRPGSRHSAVVVGAGLPGIMMARVLQQNQGVGHSFAGWFDDRSDGRVDADVSMNVLGTLKDAAPYILAHGIKEVYVTLPLGSQPRILKLLESIQGTTASIFLVPDLFGIGIIQGRLHDMKGIPVVGICESPFTGTNQLAKRASDVLLASIVLVLAAPLLLAIAIGVKLSSAGPALLKQRRNGLDGDEFTVYTFRATTTQDSGPAPSQGSGDGPRLTRFGSLLRRMSLDKLPQFFNVLRGQMSIVGPRPHAAAHHEMYREQIRAYMVRHKVKPGITGWEQINSQHGEADGFERMKTSVEFDLEYLRDWSLQLDLKIIVRAVWVALFDQNARSFAALTDKLHRLQD